MRSETQALSQPAGGMAKLIELQGKRHKEEMEFEKERDRVFLEILKREPKKKRLLKYLHHQLIILNKREILDIPLPIKLSFNILFNTLQIFIMLRVPHHNLHHHQCDPLNIIMQAHPCGHLTVQNKT